MIVIFRYIDHVVGAQGLAPLRVSVLAQVSLGGACKFSGDMGFWYGLSINVMVCGKIVD